MKAKICDLHGDTSVYEFNGKSSCRICRNERLARWRTRLKQDLVDAAGGSCQCCGYDRCLGALHFHHVDPATKNFEVSVGSNRSKIELLQEVTLCALVCANCHAEIHAGLQDAPSPVDPTVIKQLIEAEEAKKCPGACHDCGATIRRTSRRCKRCSAHKREKIAWPTDEVLLEMVEASSCYRVSIDLGVSNNAVKKRLDRIRNKDS